MAGFPGAAGFFRKRLRFKSFMYRNFLFPGEKQSVYRLETKNRQYQAISSQNDVKRLGHHLHQQRLLCSLPHVSMIQVRSP